MMLSLSSSDLQDKWGVTTEQYHWDDVLTVIIWPTRQVGCDYQAVSLRWCYHCHHLTYKTSGVWLPSSIIEMMLSLSSSDLQDKWGVTTEQYHWDDVIRTNTLNFDQDQYTELWSGSIHWTLIRIKFDQYTELWSGSIHWTLIRINTLNFDQDQYTELWSGSIHWTLIRINTLNFDQDQYTELWSGSIHWTLIRINTLNFDQDQYAELWSGSIHWTLIRINTLNFDQDQYAELWSGSIHWTLIRINTLNFDQDHYTWSKYTITLHRHVLYLLQNTYKLEKQMSGLFNSDCIGQLIVRATNGAYWKV